MYKKIIKPIFFSLDPERAHYLAMDALQFVSKLPGGRALIRSICKPKNQTPVNVLGIQFPNNIGLAAGFDKDARWVDLLEDLGFGFIEIGTVTPLAQPGNDKPRLFRLPLDNGLINRMGFNNGGSKAAAERLRRRKSKIIIGGNIGKNKVTPNEKAVDDYIICFHDLFDVVDYFVVNVSSPNTPGLRELQDKEPLLALLKTLQDLNNQKPNPKPILLKIAPDLTDSQLDDIVEITISSGIAGVVATNTTISREGLKTERTLVESIGAGGLSGAPVRQRSTEVVAYLHKKSGGAFPIIGVGGILTKEDVKEKTDAGATLVQVYSGFIYEGPAMVKKLLV